MTNLCWFHFLAGDPDRWRKGSVECVGVLGSLHIPGSCIHLGWVPQPCSVNGITDIMSDKLPHSAPPSGEPGGNSPGAGEVAGSNVTQAGPRQTDLVGGVVDSNVSSPDAQVVILKAEQGVYSQANLAGAQVLAAGSVGGVAGSNVSSPNVQAVETREGVAGSNITPSIKTNPGPSITTRREPAAAVSIEQDTDEGEAWRTRYRLLGRTLLLSPISLKR